MNADQVHTMVSEAYARAVTENAGCCGGGKSAAARTAGYSGLEMAALPDTATASSFGCGNPLAFSSVREGETVLDLGCGTGLDLLIAAQKVGAKGRVIGVDMTDAMLERARANAEGAANIEIRKGYIEALPVETASVDWVISNCVINLSPDKPRVFAEIARVLRPGGRILVSDIVAHDLPDWVRSHPAFYTSCVAGALSEEDYVSGLRAAGLRNVAVRYRHVYDADQLVALVESDLSEELRSVVCCGTAGARDAITRAASEVAGKVWSATFHGERA